MNLSGTWSIIAIVAGATLLQTVGDAQAPQKPVDKAAIRRALFAELRPVRLSNCTLERYGEKNDGGYLVCGNLLGAVRAGYSYGISGYDGWGCDVSRKLKVRVHQYDCFDLRRPACPGGDTMFHPECVGGTAGTRDKRVFDTIGNQFRKNGDAGRPIIMKIDVDRKLKRFFHVVHVHFNNWSCVDTLKPFPAWAYEVLFVNKKLGVLDPSKPAGRPSPLDARNNPEQPDCQVAFR
jgi:hypothetical protein